MHPKTCPECGGAVRASRAAVPIQFRGETVPVSGVEHGQCANCGEVYLSLDAMTEMQKRAAAQVRQSRGLLQPEEIKALRLSLSMSLPAFESLLGVGPKTVIRWEKGTVVQSATANALMKLVRDVPAVLPALLGKTAAPVAEHAEWETGDMDTSRLEEWDDTALAA